jgi:prepilin-type N-terminal cleavage/methylation domain-containing protein/prepilin-type processing-associated H-X9-DG protein
MLGIVALQNPHGFSLVELLVVVVVAAVFMGMLVPALSNARGEDLRSVCAANLKQLAAIFHTYAQDSDGYILPILKYGNPGNTTGTTWYETLNDTNLLPYDSWSGKESSVVRCPSQTTVPSKYGGKNKNYGMNWYLNTHILYDGTGGKKLSGVANPSQQFLVGECVNYPMYTPGVEDFRYPHDDGMNLLYVDGHTALYARPLPADDNVMPWR